MNIAVRISVRAKFRKRDRARVPPPGTAVAESEANPLCYSNFREPENHRTGSEFRKSGETRALFVQTTWR
jgi:hypothetical protein